MVLGRMWSLRLSTFPVPELDHIRYICMVDDRRARQVLGFTPQMSLEDTVRSVDDGRW
jgi:UDP-glucose 4-epimerase